MPLHMVCYIATAAYLVPMSTTALCTQQEPLIALMKYPHFIQISHMYYTPCFPMMSPLVSCVTFFIMIASSIHLVVIALELVLQQMPAP